MLRQPCQVARRNTHKGRRAKGHARQRPSGADRVIKNYKSSNAVNSRTESLLIASDAGVGRIPCTAKPGTPVAWPRNVASCGVSSPGRPISAICLQRRFVVQPRHEQAQKRSCLCCEIVYRLPESADWNSNLLHHTESSGGKIEPDGGFRMGNLPGWAKTLCCRCVCLFMRLSPPAQI